MTDHGPPCYLWLDLETTGLNPVLHEILEVACLATDERLVQVGAVCSWVVRHEPTSLTMSPKVSEMHTKNGLLDELRGAPYRLAGVEVCIMGFCAEIFGEGPPPILAGSSIHFDAGFLKVHTPALARRLHYRLFDVSVLKMAAKTAWGTDLFAKDAAHRALPDVLASLEAARKVMDEMARHEPGNVCRVGCE